MPLLITPLAPFTTTAGIPLASVYAIIMDTRYQTRKKNIFYQVEYYYSEQAYLDEADPVRLPALQASFTEPATPAEANAVPIFQFLEQVLTQQLTQLLGEGTTIENVA